MSKDSVRPELQLAIEAAQNKKAAQMILLDLSKLNAFTESFLLCTAFSAPQVKAISDAIEEQLTGRGLRVAHREGYERAEWVLLDYGGFIVHIFNERARQFYDLERLWRAGRRVEIPEPGTGANPDAGSQGMSPGVSE